MSRAELGHAGLVKLTKEELAAYVQELRAKCSDLEDEAAGIDGYVLDLERLRAARDKLVAETRAEREARLQEKAKWQGAREELERRVENAETIARTLEHDLSYTKRQRDELAGMVRVLGSEELQARVDRLTESVPLPFRVYGGDGRPS